MYHFTPALAYTSIYQMGGLRHRCCLEVDAHRWVYESWLLLMAMRHCVV